MKRWKIEKMKWCKNEMIKKKKNVEKFDKWNDERKDRLKCSLSRQMVELPSHYSCWVQCWSKEPLISNILHVMQ